MQKSSNAKEEDVGYDQSLANVVRPKVGKSLLSPVCPIVLRNILNKFESIL